MATRLNGPDAFGVLHFVTLNVRERKRPFARPTRNLDALLQSEDRLKAREWLSAKGRRELWQDGKHSLPLFSADWIRQRIAYIHDNPVRAGLVDHADDYVWSSFNGYEQGGAQPPVRVDLWEG